MDGSTDQLLKQQMVPIGIISLLKKAGFFDTIRYDQLPTWQLVFDWFNDHYKLSSHVDLKAKNHLGENWYFQIINHADFIDDSTTFNDANYESRYSARLACLRKLLTYVQN